MSYAELIASKKDPRALLRKMERTRLMIRVKVVAEDIIYPVIFRVDNRF